MTAPLTLIRLHPDMRALTRWGIAKGYLPKRGDADLGYALHAALKSALDELAPAPFFLRCKSSGDYELLGYCAAALASLKEAMLKSVLGDGGAAAALVLSNLEARDMPVVWRAGAEWSFETRVRPVIRSHAARADKSAGREVDYAAWAAECASREGTPPLSKETAYLEWLARELARNGAAQVIEARPIAIRRSRVLRRTQGVERNSKSVEGPDVWFRGQLRVNNGTAFANLLRRGLGRHRAFGFGCLLLAPPGSFL